MNLTKTPKVRDDSPAARWRARRLARRRQLIVLALRMLLATLLGLWLLWKIGPRLAGQPPSRERPATITFAEPDALP